MAKKPKQSKKATTKNTSSKFTSFYNAMSTRKKLLYGTTVFTVLIATVLLLLLRNQFADSGWYTSNWLYVAYTSLLLTLALILFTYKSLFKFSRLSILSVLLMIFIVSILLSVDHYKYFLDLTSPVEITNTTDSHKEPALNNIPQEDNISESITDPSSQFSSQPNTSRGTDNQSICVRKEIPYLTKYVDVSYLQKGQTSEAGGMNGTSLDCGDGKPIILKPVDKTVYVGTGLTDAEIEQQQIAAQQEYDKQYMDWVRKRASAYKTCMSSLPLDYPSKESFCEYQSAQQAGPPPQTI